MHTQRKIDRIRQFTLTAIILTFVVQSSIVFVKLLLTF